MKKIKEKLTEQSVACLFQNKNKKKKNKETQKNTTTKIDITRHKIQQQQFEKGISYSYS